MIPGSAPLADARRLLERARQLRSSSDPPLEELLTVSGWLAEQALADTRSPSTLGSAESVSPTLLLEVSADLRQAALRTAQTMGPKPVAEIVEQRLLELERKQRELQRDAERSPAALLAALLG